MGSHLIPWYARVGDKTIGLQQSWYWQFALTLLVLTIPGRRFTLASLYAGAFGAGHELAVRGNRSAFGYCWWRPLRPTCCLKGRCVYYEVAAVIVALILLGRFLEARAKGRTRSD